MQSERQVWVARNEAPTHAICTTERAQSHQSDHGIRSAVHIFSRSEWLHRRPAGVRISSSMSARAARWRCAEPQGVGGRDGPSACRLQPLTHQNYEGKHHG